MSHVKDATDQFRELSQWLHQQINALRDQGNENHTTLLEGQDNIKNVLYQIRSSQYQIRDQQRILESKLDDQANEISQLRILYEKEQSRSKPKPGTNERSLKRERTSRKPNPKRVRRSNQQDRIGEAEPNGGTDRRRSSRIAHANEGIAKT
ncbi:unnamed protein product [Aureobasidium vineae]|uniref:Uncharacterized protein n=1 Tax=Aureobasidium vineae TaxID=2773715 RepID=A0A9N8JAP4_9PEZI|nr:unnamed protein product [Aureobasidium vineae]